MTAKCRYCGAEFIKDAPSQRVCKSKACQWAKKKENIYRYIKKLRSLGIKRMSEIKKEEK